MITTYPPKGEFSSNDSALSWYSKKLVISMPVELQKEILIIADTLDDSEVYSEDNILVERSWKRFSLKFFVQILRTIRKYPTLEVVHIQHEFNLFGSVTTIPLYLLLLIALKILGKRVVVTYHGVISCKSMAKDFGVVNQLKVPLFLVKFGFFVTYFFSKFFISKVIVHEDIFADILADEYLFNKKKLDIIPIGVDTKQPIKDKKSLRKELGIPENKKVVLFFGFLARYKGIDTLLEAIKLLGEDYFLVLGGGKAKRVEGDPTYEVWYDGIMEMVKDVKNIKVTGFIENEYVDKYFQAADLLVLPYLQLLAASGPMSLAISNGLPFIASSVFERVVDSKYVFEKSNAKDLVTKTSEIFTSYEIIGGYITGLQNIRNWISIGKQYAHIYA